MHELFLFFNNILIIVSLFILCVYIYLYIYLNQFKIVFVVLCFLRNIFRKNVFLDH